MSLYGIVEVNAIYFPKGCIVRAPRSGGGIRTHIMVDEEKENNKKSTTDDPYDVIYSNLDREFGDSVRFDDGTKVLDIKPERVFRRIPVWELVEEYNESIMRQEYTDYILEKLKNQRAAELATHPDQDIRAMTKRYMFPNEESFEVLQDFYCFDYNLQVDLDCTDVSEFVNESLAFDEDCWQKDLFVEVKKHFNLLKVERSKKVRYHKSLNESEYLNFLLAVEIDISSYSYHTDCGVDYDTDVDVRILGSLTDVIKNNKD